MPFNIEAFLGPPPFAPNRPDITAGARDWARIQAERDAGEANRKIAEAKLQEARDNHAMLAAQKAQGDDVRQQAQDLKLSMALAADAHGMQADPTQSGRAGFARSFEAKGGQIQNETVPITDRIPLNASQPVAGDLPPNSMFQSAQAPLSKETQAAVQPGQLVQNQWGPLPGIPLSDVPSPAPQVATEKDTLSLGGLPDAMTGLPSFPMTPAPKEEATGRKSLSYVDRSGQTQQMGTIDPAPLSNMAAAANASWEGYLKDPRPEIAAAAAKAQNVTNNALLTMGPKDAIEEGRKFWQPFMDQLGKEDLYALKHKGGGGTGGRKVVEEKPNKVTQDERAAWKMGMDETAKTTKYSDINALRRAASTAIAQIDDPNQETGMGSFNALKQLVKMMDGARPTDIDFQKAADSAGVKQRILNWGGTITDAGKMTPEFIAAMKETLSIINGKINEEGHADAQTAYDTIYGIMPDSPEENRSYWATLGARHFDPTWGGGEKPKTPQSRSHPGQAPTKSTGGASRADKDLE